MKKSKVEPTPEQVSSLALLKVENNRFIIKEFETEDQDIVSYFSELKPDVLESRFETSLKVGVSALRTIGLTEKIDYIQKEFNSLCNKFNESFNETTLTLDQKLEEIFGDRGKVSEVIKEHFGEDGIIVKSLFDPMKEGSPLYELRVEIQKEIQNLRSELGIKEAVEKVELRTTLKGYKFEDYCEDILSKIARQQGDILERTSNKLGKVKLSKKGDFVLTLGGKKGKRIVFEVKDVGTFSQPEIINVLDEAMKNREASYGVLVVKSIESLPASVGWFNEYNGNQLVCALSSEASEEQIFHEEIMFIAYKWAKAKVLLETLKEERVDPAFIRDKISAIQTKLGDMKAIRTQCTNIEKSSEEIKQLTSKVEREISDELTSILTSMSTGKKSD